MGQNEMDPELREVLEAKGYTIGRLMATEFDGSVCHQGYGRHYHCGSCGGGPTGMYGHMGGTPARFSCEAESDA